MTLKKFTQKTPQQWLRIALIPALGAVLLVLIRQPVTGDSQGVESLDADSNATAQPISPAQEFASKWPTLTLAEVLAYDPFEPPRAVQTEHLDAASSEQRSGAKGSVFPAASLGKVQAIYFDAHGKAAIVESKVIRVGDTLPDRKRIVDITAQGIIVEGF